MATQVAQPQLLRSGFRQATSHAYCNSLTHDEGFASQGGQRLTIFQLLSSQRRACREAAMAVSEVRAVATRLSCFLHLLPEDKYGPGLDQDESTHPPRHGTSRRWQQWLVRAQRLHTQGGSRSKVCIGRACC